MCNCGHGLSYMENFRVIEQPPKIILKIQFFTQKFINIKGKNQLVCISLFEKKIFWTTLGEMHHISVTFTAMTRNCLRRHMRADE